MKRIISHACIYVMISCFSPIFAQDSTAALHSRSIEHPWALEFGISSYLTLGQFQGSMISLSRYVSTNQKIRLGISPRFSSHSSITSYFPPETLSGSYTSSFTDGSVGISAQYLSYEAPDDNFSLFLAIGPILRIDWSRYDGSHPRYMYSVGLLGSGGVEWFATKKISLHAEYGLDVNYLWNKQETSTSSVENKSLDISGQSVLFGLSVGF